MSTMYIRFKINGEKKASNIAKIAGGAIGGIIGLIIISIVIIYCYKKYNWKEVY